MAYTPFKDLTQWLNETFADIYSKLSGSGVKGDKGDKGDPGPAGPQGPKGDPGTSSTGGGGSNTYPEIINLPDVTYKSTIKPSNYGVLYNDGTRQDALYTDGYKLNYGVNGNSNRPDLVWTHWSYGGSIPNAGYQGSLMKNGVIERRTELSYRINGDEVFEDHLCIYDLHGNEHRWWSYYGSKETGRAFLNHEIDYMALFRAKQGAETIPQQYLSFSPARIDANITKPGEGSGFFMHLQDGTDAGHIANEGGVSRINFPGTFIANGYGHTRLFVGTYSDDVAAKASGLVQGDCYWSLMNGRKVLTQVQ